MKNNLKVVLLCVCLIIGIGLSVWFTISNPLKSKTLSNQDTKPKQDVIKNEKVIKNTGLKPSEVAKLTDNQKDEFIGGDGKEYDDNLYRIVNENDEYPEQESKILKIKLMDLASVASYDKILDTVKNQTSQYKFTTGTNLEIASIYHDASLMLTLITVPEANQGKIAKGMMNPEMIVIGTMMLPEPARRPVITDKDSISPIFSGAVKIISSEEKHLDMTDTESQRILDECDGGEFIHKIVFEVEKKQLTAYVVGYRNATIELYGIYAPEGNKYYFQNIRFWEQSQIDEEKRVKSVN